LTQSHPLSTRRGRKLREAKLRSVNWLCERCRAASKVAVTVHHIVALEDGGDPYPPLEGLTAYCADCHKQRHGARPRVRVDPKTGCPLPGSDHWWCGDE
jgi:5-methylcytosine-specific restriction enzyme A